MTSHFTKNALSYQESGDGTNNAIWHYMGQELIKPLTSDQMRAARALLRWSAEDLAQRSSVSLRTIRRAELAELHTTLTTANNLAIRRALESAGIEFIDENGGGPGVRRRKGPQKKR
jgi:ribosome-binding protein aMBF1 (putative translation factor)